MSEPYYTDDAVTLWVGVYPHCKHCCWSHDDHADTHHTPCWTGCTGATPITQGEIEI